MYKNGKEILGVLTVLLIVLVNGSLIKKGWYRTHSKGPKNVLFNIEYIDSKAVPDSKYLRISGRISALGQGSVRNLTKVSTLKLAFCGIKEITPGALLNLPNLSTLALPDNELELIKAGVFNNLTITTLFLQRNQIHTIEKNAFNNMPNLYRIKLNSNKLTTWDSDWFLNSPHLTELFFRRNEFTRIPGNAFKNIKGSHLINGTFTVDTKIYLSKNSISSIDPTAFQDIEELSQLWLDRNSIKEINEDLFKHMTQIGVIFLSKNLLTIIPDKIFSHLQADLLTLDLTGNNNLTCVSYDIVSKVKINVLVDIKKLNCKCIENLGQKLLEDGKNNEIKTDCQKGDV